MLMRIYDIGKSTVLSLLADADVQMRQQGLAAQHQAEAVELYIAGWSAARARRQVYKQTGTILLYVFNCQPLDTAGVDGVQKRARLSAGPGDCGQVGNVASGHLVGFEVGVGQTEALGFTGLDRSPFSRPAPDALVLHERDPLPVGSVHNPGGVFDGLVLRPPVMLGERHQLDAGRPQQLRHLNATKTPIDKDERKVSHLRLRSERA